MSCTANTTPGQGYTPCNKPISDRLKQSRTMGSMVNCEHHWIAYHAQYNPDAELTFEGMMKALKDKADAERNRPKKCAVCQSKDATYNPSAGRDLCAKHWDEY